MKRVVIVLILQLFAVSCFETDYGDLDPDSWQYDFVAWWSYAKFPLVIFVFASSCLTWFYIYKNKHRFELIEKTNKEDKTLKIFYGTQTGNAKYFSELLQDKGKADGYLVTLYNMKDVDPEDVLTEEANTRNNNSICVFIISTYTEGTPPESAEWFCKYLEEAGDDCRVQKSMLKGLNYTVFALGNSIYEDHYNTVGINLDTWLEKLSANRCFALGLGDENVQRKGYGTLSKDFEAWSTQLFKSLNSKNGTQKDLEEKPLENGLSDKSSCCQNKENEKDSCCENKESGKESCCKEEKPVNYESDDEKVGPGIEIGGGCKSGITDTANQNGGLVDMEDIGNVMNDFEKSKEDEFIQGFVGEKTIPQNREMVTPMLQKSLEKQGYKIIGSHSGVKICRWTKSMMRGRGGCYKHTFYGIASHRCMETTPSLACANKCVFCWRHHTNPVGTEWKWKMDPPEMIVKGALENHYKMVKQFRGVPGVKPDRYKEAWDVQHCALSLVGEPIMYPEINTLIDLLHAKKISTFLVTNAQFPDAIKALKPVTQLYVSVDAGTKDSLKKIDRPLFKDFWQRFLDSLLALEDKGQRTVYRLTLVKSFNTEELEAYSKLVDLGKPGFIEIKGVTYCGDSKASNLTMANVPWHDEVIGFVQQLVDMLPDYEIASEHEHSNCVLIAHKRFFVNNKWHTWIDYPKYHQLMAKYEETDGKETFSDIDYMDITPEWAVFGNDHRGFDPDETRWRRKQKTDIGGC